MGTQNEPSAADIERARQIVAEHGLGEYQPDPADVESTDLRQRTASGAVSDAATSDVDVQQEALRMYEEGLASGQGHDTAYATAVSAINFAAQHRDPKVSSQVDYHVRIKEHQAQAERDSMWLNSRS